MDGGIFCQSSGGIRCSRPPRPSQP